MASHHFQEFLAKFTNVVGNPQPLTDDVQRMKDSLASYVDHAVNHLATQDGTVWQRDSLSRVTQSISETLGNALAHIEANESNIDVEAVKGMIDNIVNQNVTLERLRKRSQEIEDAIRSNMASLMGNYRTAPLSPEAKNAFLGRSLMRNKKLQAEVENIQGYIRDITKSLRK